MIQENCAWIGLMVYVENETEFEYRYAFGALGFIGLLRTWLHSGLCGISRRHGSVLRIR